MTTPIDRESVERWECSACPRTMDPEMVADPLGDWVRYEDFRAALDAAEATSARIVSAYRINMMRHMSNYSHEAFDQHIAALQENPDG